MLKLTKDMSM